MAPKGETEEKQRTTAKLQKLKEVESEIWGKIGVLGGDRWREWHRKRDKVVRVRGEKEEEEEEEEEEKEGLRGDRKMDLRWEWIEWAASLQSLSIVEDVKGQKWWWRAGPACAPGDWEWR